MQQPKRTSSLSTAVSSAKSIPSDDVRMLVLMNRKAMSYMYVLYSKLSYETYVRTVLYVTLS